MANQKRETSATAKMADLYHFLTADMGGEPKDLWVFDPAEFDDPPPFLGVTHVAAWPADARCDVTSFHTLGMSNRRMSGADYFTELHWPIRARLKKQQRLEMARRLADMANYPFQYGLKLDWWEVITNPGPIPHFAGCRHMLLHPRLTEQGTDEIDHPDGAIKVLYIIPITPQERHLLIDHGRDALREHWDGAVDVLGDRWAPREWYNPNERYGGPET